MEKPYCSLAVKAIIYESFQAEPQLRDLPDPVPTDEGVVLEVLATGMCRSDWHGWMGHDPGIRLPHVPGHEIVGRIVEKGRFIQNFEIGERVTLPFVCGCGSCGECQSGNEQVCDNQSQPGFTHWGSFAERVRIDYADTNLVRVPEYISNEAAASLGCRFITAFRAVVDQAGLKEGQTLAVHGCGGVGLSAVMIAKALGAKVIAVDIDEKALEIATRLGADHSINANDEPDLVGKIMYCSKGGANVSIDAFGSGETALNSLQSLRKRGKHVQVGLMTLEDSEIKIPMDLVLAHELEIIGSHGMQAHRYDRVFKMIEKDLLDPAKLVTKTIHLEEAARMLPEMNSWNEHGVVVINDFS